MDTYTPSNSIEGIGGIEGMVSSLHTRFSLPSYWLLKPGDPRFEWYEARIAEGDAAIAAGRLNTQLSLRKWTVHDEASCAAEATQETAQGQAAG